MASAYYTSADDNGRREHPLGYGHDVKEMAEAGLCAVFMVMDGVESFSVCVVLKVASPCARRA